MADCPEPVRLSVSEQCPDGVRREHLNGAKLMVSGKYCQRQRVFPDMVYWTRLRNIWAGCQNFLRASFFASHLLIWGKQTHRNKIPLGLQSESSGREPENGNKKVVMEDRFLFCGGKDSLENFTADFSASTPVYKTPPPMGPEILYTTGAGEGVKVSVAIFPSSGGGV